MLRIMGNYLYKVIKEAKNNQLINNTPMATTFNNSKNNK